MPYPKISSTEARTYLIALREQTEQPRMPSVRIVSDGDDVDWETVAEEVAVALLGLTESKDEEDREINGSEFEIDAGPVIHTLLPDHPALADPEFWMWLAVIHGAELVWWRYGPRADIANFGVGGRNENFYFRLWLRAEIAYDTARKDPYELVKFGDIDFWRSHLFRQRFSEARVFARALLNYQFPADAGRKPRLKIPQIRELVKHIKRARTNLIFELMTEVRATEFIESEWARLGESR